jgi:(E)-4-hydroxy-3-methyl-but-2-enyl pyrophosphate reductase
VEILVSRVTGFCRGVEQAVHGVLQRSKPGHTFTLGPLIHNPQVVEELAARGVGVKDSLEEFHAGELLVIPAQGIRRDIWEEAQRRGIEALDFTCPELARTRAFLEASEQQGYQCLFLGDAGHAETESLLSFAPRAQLFTSLEELGGIVLRERVALFAQSTQSSQTLGRVAASLVPEVCELRVFNTICMATRQRQESLRRLLPLVEAVVVVGGRNSANTRHLAEIASSAGKRVFYVESAEELKPDPFLGVTKVGVASGASTPADVVQGVVSRLRQFNASSPEK